MNTVNPRPSQSTRAAARSLRNQELKLLLAVYVFILAGLAFVTTAKLSTHPAPPGAVNINTADASTLAHTLNVPVVIANMVVETRSKLRGHQFGSVYDLRHSKALHGFDISLPSGGGGGGGILVAREAGEVVHAVDIGAIAFVLAFLLVHIVLRKAAPDGDPLLLPIVALLSGIGLIAVFTVQDPLRDTFVFAGQASGVAFFGALAMLVPLSKPFGRLILRRYLYAYGVAGIALVVMLILFGTGPGGVHLRLFGIEPVEIVKLLLVLFVVSFLADRRGLISGALDPLPRKQDFAPLIVIYLITMLLFKVMNDLGPAVLLFGTFITLLYLSTGRRLYPIAGVVLLLVAGFVGYKMHMGFFETRVTMWLHPWKNPDPRGGQLADGLWGMATGGFFGSGLGLGQPGLMPRAGSDLVFASIGEELGIFGTTGLLIVYSILVARGYRIAKNAATEFDRLLAAGLTTLIGLQTMMIIGGVTGLVPLTGITLPFISFGSSSLVVDFFSIGLLLNISQKSSAPQYWGGGAAAVDQAEPQWSTGLRFLSMGTAAYFLIGIFLFRLVPVQLLQSTATALRPLNIPDRDGVARDHMNPRLIAYAQSIPRGRILDRNGIVLAEDAVAGSSNGVPYLNPEGRARVYTHGESVCLLLKAIEGDKRRDNPMGENDTLRGYDSNSDLLASYRRRYLPGFQPLHGNDVHLTIDMNVQRVAYDSLVHYAAAAEGKGAAVVLDSGTGEVLAAVSCPSFDPSTLTPIDWAKLQTQADGPLFNRWGKGLYPPGSTFKIVTATAALQHGLGSTIVDCHHVNYGFHWTYDGKNYSHRRVTDDTGMPAHGNIDLPGAIRVSCNVYYATVADMMGSDALHDTAVNDFHMAHIPAAKDFVDDLPDCGYGQGRILATPLEMAGVAQAVANNGWQMPVTFVKTITPSPFQGEGGGEVSSGGGLKGHMAMSAADAGVLQNAMLSVTQTGTAAGVFNGLRVQVAGKTGSAQSAQGIKTHSWFIGFAPADRPSIAFACVVERGGFGRSAAAPVCRDIVRAAL